jgi:malonate transporter and related proteins
MGPVLASLISVFLVIVLGWLTRVTGFVADGHWAGLERVTYVILFPALVINTLAGADLASVPLAGVAGALVVAIAGLSALLLAVRPWLQRRTGLDGPGFTSLFQGSTRWNTFVALSLAGSLHGGRGVTVMAVAIAAMVPLLNVLALAVLVRFATARPHTWAEIAVAFITNPFIWSCAVGLAVNPVSDLVPRPVASALDIVGAAALATGLLVVGAGLDLTRLVRPRPVHLLAMALKLLLLPAVAVSLARLLGVEGADLAVTAVAASVPTATASYLLAKQLGGDAPLMAEIITVQTVAALVTMPFMISFLFPS